MKWAFLILLALMGCQSAFRLPSQSFPKDVALAEIKLISPSGAGFDLLDLLAHKKGLVIIFWQSKCPCVRRYQARINELYNAYKEELAFYHVSSNSDEAFEDVALEYKKRGILVPLLRDEKKRLALAVKAKSTPTAALFNAQGQLVFLGWIDNERRSHESGRIAYLENALQDLLHERAIALPTSPMFGCDIN